MKKTLSITAIAAISSLTACAPHQQPPPPLPPKAGTLLQSAPLASELSIPQAATALRITYNGTNGVTGSGLIPVSGEVLIPPGPAPQGGWPVVAWAHGTVGIASQCAPSQNPFSKRNAAYIAAWLQRGFAIVATDYQGLGTPGTHPYLNARAEAYNVLDSVRAALSGVPNLANKIMIVGQSQGAGAAFAAAAYAPQYAPELNIRGTVATGIPYMSPQIVQTMLTAAQHKPAHASKHGGKVDPVVAYGLLIGASYGGIDPTFDPNTAFTSKAMNAYHTASQVCLSPLLDQVKQDGLTQRNAFRPGFAKALAPAIKAMMYPTLKLAQPLFVGTGSADIDVAAAGQKALVHDACAAGSVVQAHVYKGLDHSQTVLASLPDSAAFTKAVMQGETLAPQCTPTPQ
ncbi:lipase family protein [Kozakia baliensis]|uniref:Signal peptide-containing protein n=1 Tax=Kozakia baliensis TaxID=153496 RepID=A0A1D8UU50_9PROT|nr:lipase family protein [Kozakia baliensis]AOX17180.1 signal peptide-containing protein [Kozakia baliensis]GEL64501.1 lipase [Kozakia baliensis]